METRTWCGARRRAWTWPGTTGACSPTVLYPTGGAVGRIQVADLDGGARRARRAGRRGLQVLRWADGDVAVEPVGLSAPATWSGIGFDVADLTGDGRRDIAMLEGAGVAIRAGARRVMGRTGDRRPARSRHVGSLEGARHERPGRGRPRRHRRDQRMERGKLGRRGCQAGVHHAAARCELRSSHHAGHPGRRAGSAEDR